MSVEAAVEEKEEEPEPPITQTHTWYEQEHDFGIGKALHDFTQEGRASGVDAGATATTTQPRTPLKDSMEDKQKLKVAQIMASLSLPSNPSFSNVNSRSSSPSTRTQPASSASSSSVSIAYTPSPFDPILYDSTTWTTLSPKLAEFLANTDIKQLDWKPILFLIPSRIGIEKINEAYIPHIKHLLASRYAKIRY